MPLPDATGTSSEIVGWTIPIVYNGIRVGLIQVTSKPGLCSWEKCTRGGWLHSHFLGLPLLQKQVLTRYVCATAVLTCWNASVWLVCLGDFLEGSSGYGLLTVIGNRFFNDASYKSCFHDSTPLTSITTSWLADVLGVSVFFWMVVCENCHWKCTKFWPEPDSREVQEDLQNRTFR